MFVAPFFDLDQRCLLNEAMIAGIQIDDISSEISSGHRTPTPTYKQLKKAAELLVEKNSP